MRSPIRSPRLSARAAARTADPPLAPASRLIFKVRSDDGRAVVVVAGIQNQADGVPHPFGGLHGTEFVEYKDISSQTRDGERPVRWFERWHCKSSEFLSTARDSHKTRMQMPLFRISSFVIPTAR